MSKITETPTKDIYQADINKTFSNKVKGKTQTGTITMSGRFELSDIRQIIGWMDNAIN